MSIQPEILVADDDENDLQLTLVALDQCGGNERVVTVSDGADALDYLLATGRFRGRAPGNPQLLLLDLNMPRIDGWEVLRAVKTHKQLRTIPVVVFTSSARDSDLEQCYQLGANAYVVKPTAFDEFNGAVKVIQAFWTKYNRPLQHNISRTESS